MLRIPYYDFVHITWFTLHEKSTVKCVYCDKWIVNFVSYFKIRLSEVEQNFIRMETFACQPNVLTAHKINCGFLKIDMIYCVQHQICTGPIFSWVHFYQHGLISIPTCIVITLIINCWIKLLIHSKTSTVQPLKFGNGQVISSHTLLFRWLLIHVGIKVNPY